MKLNEFIKYIKIADILAWTPIIRQKSLIRRVHFRISAIFCSLFNYIAIESEVLYLKSYYKRIANKPNYINTSIE